MSTQPAALESADRLHVALFLLTAKVRCLQDLADKVLGAQQAKSLLAEAEGLAPKFHANVKEAQDALRALPQECLVLLDKLRNGWAMNLRRLLEDLHGEFKVEGVICNPPPQTKMTLGEHLLCDIKNNARLFAGPEWACPWGERRLRLEAAVKDMAALPAAFLESIISSEKTVSKASHGGTRSGAGAKSHTPPSFSQVERLKEMASFNGGKLNHADAAAELHKDEPTVTRWWNTIKRQEARKAQADAQIRKARRTKS